MKMKIEQMALHGLGPDSWTVEQMCQHTAEQFKLGILKAEDYTEGILILTGNNGERALLRLAGNTTALQAGHDCNYASRMFYQCWEDEQHDALQES